MLALFKNLICIVQKEMYFTIFKKWTRQFCITFWRDLFIVYVFLNSFECIKRNSTRICFNSKSKIVTKESQSHSFSYFLFSFIKAYVNFPYFSSLIFHAKYEILWFCVQDICRVQFHEFRKHFVVQYHSCLTMPQL